MIIINNNLVPFFNDHAEEVRVRAIDALEKYGKEAPSQAFAARLLEEGESLRLKNKVASIIAEHGWSLGEHRDAVAANPPQGFSVTGDSLTRR